MIKIVSCIILSISLLIVGVTYTVITWVENNKNVFNETLNIFN